MVENDMVLLRRFAAGADAEAFAELVRRYAQLVYSAAWRVLRQESDATDVTQQTFFELTRRAGQISGSLSGWLHKVATQKSIDLIRHSTHRRQREHVYAENQPVEVQTWDDLSGHVDRALDMLDGSVKSLLLEHFMAGKTTGQLARERGVSQATVSRRINGGLEQLRGTLRRQGLLVAAAALATMLMESPSQAVPRAVLAELSKMAMVGTTGTAAGAGGAAATITKAGLLKAALITAAGASVVTVAGYVWYARSSQTANQPAGPVQAAGQTLAQDGAPSGPTRPAATAQSPGPVYDKTYKAGSLPAQQTTVQPPAAGITDGATPNMSLGAARTGRVLDAARAQIPAADLSNSESTMYSFLARLSEGAGDQPAAYFTDEAADTTDLSSLRHLGSPVALVGISEHGDSAEATWQATPRREFSSDGRTHSPSKTLTFTSRLIRVNGLWHLSSMTLAPEEHDIQ